MEIREGKLFSEKKEVIEKPEIAPREKAKEEVKKELKKTPQFVEKVASCNVNVRKEPKKIEGNIVYVLNKGQKIKVIETKEVWLKTEDGNYIMGEYLH